MPSKRDNINCGGYSMMGVYRKIGRPEQLHWSFRLSTINYIVVEQMRRPYWIDRCDETCCCKARPEKKKKLEEYFYMCVIYFHSISRKKAERKNPLDGWRVENCRGEQD